ncbi:MAG TPA: MarR family winged helix-turn-helix transcriptional regulator [Pedobacter sp.]|jgi:DNA-binding MarR family transcriptional regulator
MSYSLYRELIILTEEFEKESLGDASIHNFSNWLNNKVSTSYDTQDNLDWEGKKNGRSAESIINTSIVHLYRYAKIYGKQAIEKTPFSTLDEMIFLLNLLHHGDMTKKQLVDLNIQEKSTGIQIINRLLSAGFISEKLNDLDKRSKYVSISKQGIEALDINMDKIRDASRTVTGNLNEAEKSQLIRLLQKLEKHHQSKIKEFF